MVTLIIILLSIPLIVSGSISYCDPNKDWTGTCATGNFQSPINIDTSHVKTTISNGIYFDYKTHKAEGEFNDHNFEVEGNFINGTLQVGSKKVGYGAQFHFHAPSEHHIDGNSYDLEMHSVQKDSSGHVAFVVGVLFKIGNSSNEFIEKVIESETEETKIDLSDVFNWFGLVNFFYYEGSLTTPPCTEGVEWLLWDKIQEISQEQFEFFNSKWAGNASLWCGNGNNRPVQELKEREVIYYDSSNLLILGLSVYLLIF